MKQHAALEKISDYKSLERLLQAAYVVWSDEESLIGRWSDPQKEAKECTEELKQCALELAQLKLKSLDLEEKMQKLERKSKSKDSKSDCSPQLSYYN